ncbi:MAG: hypothetical protein AAGF93_01390 [Cyanobacteria bacterium P01_H01_bin.105]
MNSYIFTFAKIDREGLNRRSQPLYDALVGIRHIYDDCMLDIILGYIWANEWELAAENMALDILDKNLTISLKTYEAIERIVIEYPTKIKVDLKDLKSQIGQQ